LQVIDSITAFLTWFDSSHNLSPSEKIPSFKEHARFFDPSFYDFKLNSLSNKVNDLDSYLLKIITDFPSLRDRFVLFHNNIRSNIDYGLHLMQKTFPEFNIDLPFHICHSLGECDGGVRLLNGSNAMILGIDVMAKVHNWDNEIPFIQHELFHIYQNQLFHPVTDSLYHEDALYNSLWMEGIATYISQILNPDASYREICLDIPDNLVPDCQKQMKEICSGLLENLFSKEPDQYSKYFLFNAEGSIPKRSGYYIGFLLVKAIATKFPLDQLIRLTEKEFVPLLKLNLELLLAKC
jgi:hypothetical protein